MNVNEIKAQEHEQNELTHKCNKTKEEHYEFREEALKNVKSLLDHNENAKDKNAKLTRELKQMQDDEDKLEEQCTKLMIEKKRLLERRNNPVLKQWTNKIKEEEQRRKSRHQSSVLRCKMDENLN